MFTVCKFGYLLGVAMKKLSTQNAIILDTETTGLGSQAEIVEFTADTRLIIQSLDKHCNAAYVQSVHDLFFKFCVPQCAMLWYAEFFGVWNEHHEDYKWQSLSNACAQQNVDVSDLTAHRALADCEMTRRLIHAVNSQIENQNNQHCDSVTEPNSEA